jgi:hypothetical protein
MGKRSRKRGAVVAAPPPEPVRRRRAAPERPRAPWHPFPLTELCVLIGLVLLAWGAIRGGDSGVVLVASGMALASLGGLDTALREHFGGFASHALLLAAVPAVLVAGALFFAGAPWLAIPLSAAAVFGGTFVLLRRRFRS